MMIPFQKSDTSSNFEYTIIALYQWAKIGPSPILLSRNAKEINKKQQFSVTSYYKTELFGNDGTQNARTRSGQIALHALGFYLFYNL